MPAPSSKSVLALLLILSVGLGVVGCDSAGPGLKSETSDPEQSPDETSFFEATNTLESRMQTRGKSVTMTPFGASSPAAATTSKSAPSITLTSIAQIDPPGDTTRASHLTYSGGTVYAGYKALGAPFKGGIDILDASDPTNILDVNSLGSDNVDVQEVAYDGDENALYVAAAADPSTFVGESPSLLTKVTNFGSPTTTSVGLAGQVGKSVVVAPDGDPAHDVYAITDEETLYRFDAGLGDEATEEVQDVEFRSLATTTTDIFTVDRGARVYSSSVQSADGLTEETSVGSGVGDLAIGRLHARDEPVLNGPRLFLALGSEGMAVLDAASGDVLFRKSGPPFGTYYTSVTLHHDDPAVSNAPTDLVYAARQDGVIDVFRVGAGGVDAGDQSTGLEEVGTFDLGTLDGVDFGTSPQVNQVMGVGCNVYIANSNVGVVALEIGGTQGCGGGGNQAPTAGDDSDNTTAGQPTTTDVLANDSDPDGSLDPSTVTVQSGPSDGSVSVDGSTGAITYTPDGGFTGSDSYTYTVTDGDGAESNAATVTLTVNASSSDLIVSQYVDTESGSTPKGVELWNVSGSSIDFGSRTLRVKTYNNGATSPTTTAEVESGTLADGAVIVLGGTDLQSHIGSKAPSVRVVDFGFNFNGNDALEVTLDGTPQDEVGTIGQDPGTAWTGSGVSTADQNIRLKSGITDGSDGFTDPSIRFETVVDGPTGAGDLDGFGAVPGAPIVSDDSDLTPEGQSTTTDVLANDSDPDGSLDESTVTVQSGPSDGSVSIDGSTGAITYTPDGGFTGDDSYTYTVDDGNGTTSNEATVTVTVEAFSGECQGLTVGSGSEVREDEFFDSSEDGGEDEDEQEDEDEDEAGQYAYTYEYCYQYEVDGYQYVYEYVYEWSETANQNPDPNPDPPNMDLPSDVDAEPEPEPDPQPDPPQAPTASDDTDQTDEGQSTTTDVLANDSDPDGSLDPLTVTVQSSPSDGSVSIDESTGAITYTPDGGFTGDDSYTYTVKDGDGTESNEATVTITVTQAPSAPNPPQGAKAISFAAYCTMESNFSSDDVSIIDTQENDDGEVVSIAWTSDTELSSVVLKAGTSLFVHDGGSSGGAASGNGEEIEKGQGPFTGPRTPDSPCISEEDLVVKDESVN